MVPTDTVPQITAIHASPTQGGLVFTGAGSLGLVWLHAIAGSSGTIPAAVDAYAPRSPAGMTGHLEASAVRAATAQAMAIWAYRRAQTLSEGNWPLLGVALTAALRFAPTVLVAVPIMRFSLSRTQRPETVRISC
jgi:hypothetical protein